VVVVTDVVKGGGVTEAGIWIPRRVETGERG
jgi:hypothetical protein